MTLGQYIKKLRTERGISQEELGKVIGVQRAAVQKIECGVTQNLKRTTIQKLAEYFNVNPISFIDTENKLQHLQSQGIVSPITTKRFPMLGNIACGEPIYADEEYETFVEASSNIKADFCLTAKGDSMINARIFDGDIVFIKSQPDVENGEIAAVIINDEATLKRVYKYQNRIELRPENPLYDVLNYEGAELEQIQILGKAVAFQSYIR
jgi:repressor LexA